MPPERMNDFAALVGRPTAGRQNPRKLSHLIERDLRGLILRGELAPGQALPSESDLLEAFQVSRNTLREALRILESESLIQIRRGRAGGAIVQRPQSRTVARYVSLLLQVRGATFGEVQEARLLIEPPAAAKLVDVVPADTTILAELHEAERTQLDDPLHFVTALAAFDQSVSELSGSKTIAVLSSIFRDIIAGQAYLMGRLPQGSPTFSTLANLHGEYLCAIEACDAHRAHDAWCDYLVESTKLLGQGSSETVFDVVPVWRAQAADDIAGNHASKRAASVATEIRIRIAEGKIRDGDQLPPVPELAAEFGLSRPTMRECLRILEMEGLVDLRTGSRSGATVCEPTTEMAAHLAGIVLASAQTRIADVWEARKLLEPSVLELVAARISEPTLSSLANGSADLKKHFSNTPAFIEVAEDREREIFSAVQNAALIVALEIIHWVFVRCKREVMLSALSVPQVIKSNRRTAEAFETFLAASQRGDVSGVGHAWVEHVEAISPFFRPPFGDRLLVDLLD
jgi:DNA-binding FadR family transcriptional regulator